MRADALRNRELILGAAAKVLSRDTEPTLTMIAEEAGVSRATVYRHFSDVAAVRQALLAEVTDVARNILQEHLAPEVRASGPFPDRMVRMVRAALPIRTRYADAMATEPLADAGVVATFKPMMQAMLKQAQSQSEVRADLDPGLMAEMLVSVGFYTARRVYRDGVPIDQAMQIIEVMMRGIETSPRPA
jgi:AcrR family transcriptional regulator